MNVQSSPSQSTFAAVTLFELLNRKEVRVKQQQAWLREQKLPLISFTVNMPGSVKVNKASRTVLAAGIKAVEGCCDQHGWHIKACQMIHEKTGYEVFWVVDAPSATLLKKEMIAIENQHPLGRLMDLDVLDLDGRIISRQGSMISRRRCLLCERDAVICARSHRHDLSELLAKIEEITDGYQCCV
jgi:holo-ACP synthase